MAQGNSNTQGHVIDNNIDFTKYDDGSMMWSIMNRHKQMTVLSFLYLTHENREMDNNEAICKLRINFMPLVLEHKKIIRSIVAQKVFPDMVEKLRELKGDLLDKLYFRAASKDTAGHLEIIQRSINMLKEGAAQKGPPVEKCPFYNVSVDVAKFRP